MKLIDILNQEIPLTKKLYADLRRYSGKELQEVPPTLQRQLRRLKTVPSVTASGLEKVDSLRLLLAATHVVSRDILQKESKKLNANAQTKPLQKK